MNGRLVLACSGAGVLLLFFASCEGSRQRTDLSGASAVSRGSIVALDGPAQARAAFVAAQQTAGAGNAAYAIRAAGSGFLAGGPTVGMRAELGASGATLRKAGETWSATLAGVRYGCEGGSPAAIERAGGPRAGSSDNRIEYAGRAAGVAVDEWYVSGPLGLEQGFSLGGSPCGEPESGDLVLEVNLEGLEAVTNQNGLGLELRDGGGTTRVRYTDLWARDARGAALAANMQPRPGGLALRVDARGAKFPITVDPLAWLPTAELTASAEQVGSFFGVSVAVSGTTALVGADEQVVANTTGAAYVFTQSGTTWTQQAQLTMPGILGFQLNGLFGCSVALSGTTALVGEYNGVAQDAGLRTQGQTFVFVQSGATWTQQAVLSSSDPPENNNYFGAAVSLSGTTALIGSGLIASSEGLGAAYVFVQSGTTWTQQQKLTEGDGTTSAFGSSVAVSGAVALVGAPLATVGSNATQGAVYVFVLSGTTWTMQQELTSVDGAAGDWFGSSVSGSGTTALIGAQKKTVGGNASQGAAYAFVRSGTTWTQQQELTASDGVPGDAFGSSIALSGTRVIIGAEDKTVGSNASQGAAYTFVQSGTSWTQQQELTASDGLGYDQYGSSVSLSGSTALIGAPRTHSGGASYIEAFLSTNGSSCAADTGCGSGLCVVGICCDAACSGACQSCSLTGSTGTCADVPAGGAGSPSCAPYVCTGSAIVCPTSCAGDAQCVAGDYCDAGTCVAKQPSGTPCGAPDQCASGNCQDGMCLGLQLNATACATANLCINGECVDGVCCDEACTGQCQACDVPGLTGTCSQVTGLPHGSRTACVGAGSLCGATCGAGGGPRACQYAPMGTTCAASSCSGDQTITTTCDGMGACRAAAPSTCAGAFACDAATQSCSRTSCTGDSDCASGYRCSSGACQPTGGSICSGHTSTSTAGGDAGSVDCPPYACENATGKCFGACKSVAECVVPNVCDPAGHCVAPPTNQASGGCSAAPGDGACPATLLWTLGVWFAASQRRRRSRQDVPLARNRTS